MIRTRTRKILRDIWARKGRTALVSIAIFIGVAGTIALFSMSDILVTQLRSDVKESELAMVQISLGSDPGVQLDNVAYLKMLQNYPGVSKVMAGMESRTIYFKTDENAESFDDGVVQSYQALNEDGTALVDVPFNGDMPLEPMRLLTDGQWPQAGKNELLVEQRMAEDYGLKVGDKLYIRVLSPSRDPEKNGATGTVETWTITGIVFHAYSVTPKTSVYTYTSDGNYLAGFNGFNDIWLRFIDYPTAEKSYDDIQDLIAQKTPYKVAFPQKEDPAKNSQIQGAQTIGSLMGSLALVALLVSGFLVINVISSLVLEQKRQIGVMKSLGATRGDNFFMYSGIAFFYGLIGVIPGVIVGIPGGNAAAHALAPQLNTVIEGFKLSVGSIIMGVAIGLLVPVIASLLPVFSGTRVKILTAMTDLGINARYGTGILARIIAKLPVPITVRQGLSNVSIKKSRLAFTGITLAIAVGAFMGIFAIFATLRTGINSYLDSFNLQFGIAPTDNRDPSQIKSILEENFGSEIKSIEPGFFQVISFEGYNPEPSAGGPPGIFAYGYDVNSPDPAFNFTVDQGSNLNDENRTDGIILSSLLATNMHKKVGDKVVLKVPGNSAELTVVGVSEIPIEQAWLDWRTLATIGGVTYDTITSNSPLPADAIPAQASAFIKYATMAKVDGYEGTLPDNQVIITGLIPGVGAYLNFSDGAFFSVENPGIVISQAMADKGGYKVGDQLTIEPETPEGTTTSYPIVGIFAPPTLLLSAPGGQSDGAATPTLPEDFVGMFWRDATTLDGAVVTAEPIPQVYFSTTTYKHPTAKQIDRLTDRVNEEFVSRGIPTISFNFIDLTDQISQSFATIQAILSAVAGLIALVGALGLLTTLSMSVYERQKEIGVMRSIGASSRIVATQFLTEGIVVGVISWVLGLPLMILIQMMLLSVTKMSETFPLEFSPTAAISGLVGMLVITTIASLWPSLGAARKTVSDILRYQ